MFSSQNVCVLPFMTSPLDSAVGPRSLIGYLFTFKKKNVYPFDYTSVAFSGKVGIPQNVLSTPVL